jgi:tetratricopeptide (TPR) repeat protein
VLEVVLILICVPIALYGYRFVGRLRVGAHLVTYNKSIAELKEIEASLIGHPTKLEDHHKGKLEGAISQIDALLVSYPKIPELHSVKGVILMKLERCEEALQSVERAIGLKADEADYWCTRGVVLEELGRTGEELKAYERALEISPRNDTAWLLMAGHYLRKGDKENTLKNLSEAINIDSGHKEKARNNINFKSLWGDEDFRSLTGHRPPTVQ